MTAANVARSCGIVAVVAAIGGCGTPPPTNRTPSAVPAEYQPYMRDGKVVPTGHATLDNWVHINVFLYPLKGPQNGIALPTILRSSAKFIRERSAAGVDPDVLRWATCVALLLGTRADILTQMNDPATLRPAQEEVAAGRPNPLDALERTVSKWEQERNRLVAERTALHETLSRRHTRPFPPPQL